jgi:hypothetical protein
MGIINLVGLRNVVLVVLVVAGNVVMAQNTTQPQDQLRGEITENDRVALLGDVHPALANAQTVTR